MASMLGCSTMAHIMHNNFTAQPENGWVERSGPDNYAGGFQVYTRNPYALHLGIEDTNTLEDMERLNGDGGASLNAYAACLTLKVIF
jgi:hypothetical protein